MSVRINFASVEELRTIPGVGEKLAGLIMSIREKSGNITPDILIALTRGRVSQKTIDDIDFSFNVELPDELDSSFESLDSLESTVKKESRSGRAAPEWGAAAAPLFASARVKRVQLRTSELRNLDDSRDASVSTPKADSAMDDRFDRMLELLRKTKLEKSSPDLHQQLAEQDLPPLPDVPNYPISASKLSRPSVTKGAMTPTHEPNAPLPDLNRVTRDAFVLPVPERRELGCRKKLAVPEVASALEGAVEGSSSVEGGGVRWQPEVSGEDREWQRKHNVKVMKTFPKNLVFDGKSNWSAFKHKFSTYATAFGWTSEDCLNCLSVSLTEKAADFYAILLEQKQKLTYRQLLSKLERRFGCTELPSVTQGLFEQATQAPGESLEDWADRVMTLATRAFRDLPEGYATEKTVLRICQGLADRKIGFEVCMRKPKSVEEALNMIKWHQFIYRSDTENSQVSGYDGSGVYSISSRGEAETPSVASQLDSIGNALQQRSEAIKSAMQVLNAISSGEEGTREATWWQGSCFSCGKDGHFRRECPQKQM